MAACGLSGKVNRDRCLRFVQLLFGGVLALLAAALVLRDRYLTHVATLVLLYAYLSLSWDIIGGLAGQLSLGHVAYFGLGSYTSVLLFIYSGLSPWIGMVVGGIIAVLFAVLIGYPTLRLRGAYFALSTIALSEVLRIIVSGTEQVGEYRIGGAQGINVPLLGQAPWLFQFSSKSTYFWIMVAFVAIALVVHIRIERSRLGYWLMAIREDQDAASALGINVHITKLLALCVSAFLTALGGAFYAQWMLYIEPDRVLSGDFSIELVVLALIGGKGRASGPILGAFLLVPLAEMLRSALGGGVQGAHLLVYGALVVLVVLLIPSGLIGPLQNFVKFTMDRVTRLTAHGLNAD